MSIFQNDEEEDKEYQAGRDVWAEYETKKRRDPEWFVKKNAIELMRSNPSYTVDAERKRVQKKIEEERQIKEYRTQTPNVVKTVRIQGDHDYGLLFMGEADLLAYQVRNRMKLSNVDQLQGQRIFSDGTRITVNSFFGQDDINIDVSQSTEEEVTQKQCSVTLINLPTAVQPMKEPGKVAVDEVQGTDYIKTYYTFDVGQCPDCQDIKADFLFNYSTPVESRHYDAQVENHCIYSLGSCWGEVIEHGHDDQGDYFIWKAYTEHGPYSRTGLGVLDLKASISDQTGEVICEAEKSVDVDCCLKEETARKVEIWWDHYMPGEESMFYQGHTIYKVPSTITVADLLNYAGYGYMGSAAMFYAIPEIKGGCIPFKWNLLFPGYLESWDPEYQTSVRYRIPLGGIPESTVCIATGSLSLEDRCNMSDAVTIIPCCDSPEPLEIKYTSLQMSCGGGQSLSVTGGCGPYLWTLTGGGGFGKVGVTSANGITVIYLAPGTNEDCANNPTITVTDCCGSSTSISLAVNCYGSNLMAYYVISYENYSPDAQYVCTINGEVHCMCGFTQFGTAYKCDGSWYYADPYYPNPFAIFYRFYDSGTIRPPSGNCLGADCSQGVPPPIRYDVNCLEEGGGPPTGTVIDARTELMKTMGCCPMNPFTGLPM